MNKLLLIAGILLSSTPTTKAIIEGCHDQIIKYKVLALVTTGLAQHDLVLSFNLGAAADNDIHAVAQECAQQGYELVEVKNIKVTDQPIIISNKLFQVASTVKHYKALVSVKRPDMQRPLVLEFVRRLGIMEKDDADAIKMWASQECLKKGYRLIQVQKVHKGSWHWSNFPSKYKHLLD